MLALFQAKSANNYLLKIQKDQYTLIEQPVVVLLLAGSSILRECMALWDERSI